MESFPQVSAAVKRAIAMAEPSAAADGLESVIRSVDPLGKETLVFVFRDDIKDLINVVAGICRNIAQHWPSTLFLRREELYCLAVPSFDMIPFHLADSIRVKAEVLAGDNLTISCPQWTRERLEYHFEYCADTVRGQLLLDCTFSRCARSTVRNAMLNLMLSVLIAAQETVSEAEEIPCTLCKIIPPTLCEVVDEWKAICGGPARDEAEKGSHQYEVAWIFEKLLKAMFSWMGTKWCLSRPGIFRYRHGKLVPSVHAPEQGFSRSGQSLHLPSREERQPTASLYWEAVETGLREMVRCSDIVSFPLYGSLARNQVDPGYSDIVDGYALLADECFGDYGRFAEAMHVMTSACAKMARTGLPFHSFTYTPIEHFQAHHPATILVELANNSASRTVLGPDLRALAGTSAANALFTRRLILTAPLAVRQVAGFLDGGEGETQELGRLQWAIAGSRKYLSKYLCAAANIWIPTGEALQALPGLMPDFNISALNSIIQARISTLKLNQARHFFRQVFVLTDDAAQHALTWLKRHDDDVLRI